MVMETWWFLGIKVKRFYNRPMCGSNLLRFMTCFDTRLVRTPGLLSVALNAGSNRPVVKIGIQAPYNVSLTVRNYHHSIDSRYIQI
jgi:hypothetical protein